MTAGPECGPLHAHQRLAGTLAAELGSGMWRSGDSLPSEAELIERFGMSKGTIREATRILEAQGLVRTKTGPGGGTFLHEMSQDRARALLSKSLTPFASSASLTLASSSCAGSVVLTS